MSLIDSVVVAVELFGVVVLHPVCDLERKSINLAAASSERSRGTVISGGGWWFMDAVLTMHGILAVRRERALERLAACSLASRSR